MSPPLDPHAPSTRDDDAEARARRRSFVIHAFAGLAMVAGQGCEIAGTAHAQTPPSNTMPGGAARDAGDAGDAAGGFQVMPGGLGPGARMGGSGTIGLGSIGAGAGTGTGYGGHLGLQGIGMHQPGGVVAPRPVRFGVPVVTGALSPEVVRRVIRRNTPQWFRCYDSTRTRRLRPAGRLVVRFTISATGTVLNPSIAEPGAGLASFGACLVGVVRQHQFPNPESGTVTVEQPIVVEAEVAPAATPPAPARAPRPSGRMG